LFGCWPEIEQDNEPARLASGGQAAIPSAFGHHANTCRSSVRELARWRGDRFHSASPTASASPRVPARVVVAASAGLETSAAAQDRYPVDHRDAKLRRRLANTPPAPIQLNERILHDLLSRHSVRARQASKTPQPVLQRGGEDLEVALRNLAGPSASAESGSGVTLSLRMSPMAHQAAIRFPDQPPGSSRQERGRIAPADTLAYAYRGTTPVRNVTQDLVDRS
jgi:hypothetical protein